MNNNKLKTVIVLDFDSVFASSRWQSGLFKLECHPGKTRKLHSAMRIVAQAACDDACGAKIDFSKVFAALEVVNDQTQKVWNMDDPLSL